MPVQVEEVATQPIQGQKAGTSGLRKKVVEFQKPHYLANWTQCLFDVLQPSGLSGELQTPKPKTSTPKTKQNKERTREGATGRT